jgi:peptide/nickel transport system substrate-binding protein
MTEGNYWGRNRLSRRGVIRGGGVLGAGLAGAALIGCGDDDEPGATATQPPAATGTTAPGDTSTPGATTEPGAGGPRPGGTLFINASSPQANFNPVINWHEGNQLSGLAIYDRLISPRLDERIYVLEAAEEVEVVDDVTIRFTLKEGLVYQDRAPVNGRAVVADDVVQMQLYSKDEEAAESRIFQTQSMDTVEAPDDRTVVFTLQQPNAYLWTGTQLGQPSNQCIIPSELVLGDLEQSEPVGSGPYQMSSYQFQTRYDYERNPTYRGAAEGFPYIDNRVVLAITDGAALESAFRSEQLMAYQAFAAETADRIAADLGDELVVTEFIALNPFTRNMSRNRTAWDDVRVREAFYRWFNPEPYIDLVANGWAVPVPGQLPVGLEKWQLTEAEAGDFKSYDPEAARQLLDAAGFNFDQDYELTTIAGPVNETALQVMDEQMRDIGINVVYKVAPASEWLPNITSTGEYDVSVVGHPGYDSPATPLRLNHTFSGNINAWNGIRDPQIDALIEESETLLDEAENIAKVKEVQIALLENYSHMSYVYTARQRELRYAYIQDWEVTAATHPMYRVEAWMDV